MAQFDYIEKSLDDPNYNVEDDYDAMHEEYTCDECGCTFTLDKASSDYYGRTGNSYFRSSYQGDLCGHCAADKDWG